MRPNTSTNMSALDASVNQSGLLLDASSLLYLSAQAVVTGASTGTLNIQASNDPGQAPTVWSNIPTVGTVTLSGAGTFLIPQISLCYRWVRASYVKNNGSAGTITVNLTTLGF